MDEKERKKSEAETILLIQYIVQCESIINEKSEKLQSKLDEVGNRIKKRAKRRAVAV